MEALDDGVDLGAQARREHDGFGDVLAVAKRLECLRQVALSNGAPLEDLQRYVLLVDPNGNDRHGAVTPFLSGNSLGLAER